MTGMTAANTALSVLTSLIQVGVPLTGLMIAYRAPHRRTHVIWRGLTVFFALTLVAAVGRQLIGWMAPALMSYWIATAGLPALQTATLAASLSIPFSLVSLAAWVLLAWLVVREFPWQRRA